MILVGVLCGPIAPDRRTRCRDLHKLADRGDGRRRADDRPKAGTANEASARVMARAGMVEEGTIRGHLKLTDGWREPTSLDNDSAANGTIFAARGRQYGGKLDPYSLGRI
jgi:hypothetical protein